MNAPTVAQQATLHDRDLDPVLRASPASLGLTWASIEAYQRLVTNPFLAAAAAVAWFAVLRDTLRAGDVRWGLPLLGAGLLLPFLVEFHCLDCGRTGRLARWRSHNCDAVTLRRSLGRPRLIRGPSPVTQFKLWLIAAAAAVALFVIVGV
jgi:hypothetical protein